MRRLKPGSPKRLALEAKVDRKAKLRAQKWEMKKRYLAGGLYAPSVGFKAERLEPRSMYDEFRSGRGPGRKRDDWNPYE